MLHADCDSGHAPTDEHKPLAQISEELEAVSFSVAC